jgi:plasmid maintenance system killer protein
MNSATTARFWEMYRALPLQVRVAARQAYQQFDANPAHPSLHFERLRSDSRQWSVRVTRDYRAVGIVDGNTIIWHWIGSHEDFDRTFS